MLAYDDVIRGSSRTGRKRRGHASRLGHGPIEPAIFNSSLVIESGTIVLTCSLYEIVPENLGGNGKPNLEATGFRYFRGGTSLLTL